ncbi:MAG: 16S rRNA (cytosine(967)-C(5))-methyltransferase RsmB [Roseburia sp.]|nr:16S rRNA (cytosine(967)-C(5))-methyltransferase RsmB [Roseburia sp.]MCM1098388.1 16S rRNA (cytosine(967)-C(5))-methyltransferase RsmB [Ruminococcus flavefaciens]
MAESGREIVLEILLTLEKGEEYSSRLLKAVLDKYDYLEIREKAFIKRVTEGTLERRLELDYYLNGVSGVPVPKMKPLIRSLLRMSVYQMLYMDSVPDSAVCNEACKLAAKRGFGSLRGFVNGVLRNLARKKDRLPKPDREKEPVSWLSVTYSMPEWIVRLWLEEYGSRVTETLLKGLLEIHPISLRFREDLGEDGLREMKERMEAAGAALRESEYLPRLYTLEYSGNITGLPGFAEGMWTVQDVSSALAVEAAGIRKTDFVLDACAAPGGKTLLAAEKAGKVLSRDISEAKAEQIRENAERMRAENVEIQVRDATCPDPSLQGRADVLLLDVPCSGLGVSGKKRDIKYRVTPEGILSLTKLQKEILRVCAGYVKPGGILIYSTCTVNRAENQDMVRFLTRELGFVPETLEGSLPERLLEQKREAERELVREEGTVSERRNTAAVGKNASRQQDDAREGQIASGRRENAPESELTPEEEAACIQILPGYMEADGFFIAKLRRQGV